MSTGVFGKKIVAGKFGTVQADYVEVLKASRLSAAADGAVASAATLTSATELVTIDPAAAVTGLIVTAGTHDGQKLKINNISNFNAVFDAAATSNVAGGVDVSIAPTSVLDLVYNVADSLWYPAREPKPIAPTATEGLAGAQTITAAHILTELISGDPAAAVNYTLSTAALLWAALDAPQVNQKLDFTIVNLANADEPITVVMGTGGTAVGNMVIEAPIITGEENSGSAMFRIIMTSATTYDCWRLA